MPLDFYEIRTRPIRNNMEEIYVSFKVQNTQDLIIQGRDFKAVWVPSRGLWSTNEDDLRRMIDDDIYAEYKKLKSENPETAYVMRLMIDCDSKAVDRWHKYCQKQMRDIPRTLDENVTFMDTETKREDYASKKLPYSLSDAPCPAYDELMSVLYLPEQRRKFEYAIGAVLAGDAKRLQKFIVFYGSAGTGKSTVLNIIELLFTGYWTTFSAKELGSRAAAFPLEAFKDNPLVGIEHDSDLSRIEDNTRLNSLISHETMEINEKFKSKYKMRFNTFLFIGTNKPVRITDAKSGLLRRLIDVHPSGNKVPHDRYDILKSAIPFELGAIANHCLNVYRECGFNYYDKYVPLEMMLQTNDFFDFIEYEQEYFLSTPAVPLKEAWRRYNSYCEFANVPYPLSMRLMRTELLNYFGDFKKDWWDEENHHYSSVYLDFKREKLGLEPLKKEPMPEVTKPPNWLILKEQPSLFDVMGRDWPAQYPVLEGPRKGKLETTWENCKTTLADVDTHRVHHVRTPLNHIVIDLDIRENGEKSLAKNIEAASKWPPTYAEVSKSGGGLHLHYIYSGDPTQLSSQYDEHTEIKVCNGLASLRRRLTLCNDIPVAVLTGGLPLKQKGGKGMVDMEAIQDDIHLHNAIIYYMRKPEPFTHTVDAFGKIERVLEEAYAAGFSYNCMDLYEMVRKFGESSTNHDKECRRRLTKMKFMSKDCAEKQFENFTEQHARDAAVALDIHQSFSDDRIVFFDVEVYPNLFVVCWKFLNEDNVYAMVDPSSEEIDTFMKLKLVGFNNRKYDNHILMGRAFGFNNYRLFKLSQNIINSDNRNDYFFREAYNIGYADIYDYSSKKQSLKKWEIELGIHHQEMDIPWDEPVPEEKKPTVVEYCKNDVRATEAVYLATMQDLVAREVLADLSGLTVLNTTRQHTTKIIFGNDKHPKLVYTDLSELFPGYELVDGKNLYRGIDVGFGGFVYSEPNMYTNVALLDVASLHPHSIKELNLFGDYTKNYVDILNARIAIKHHDYETTKGMLDGKLAKYLSDDESADKLAQALKIVINSVYGYTSATFENPFRDERNVNNIVALRGALFMVELMHEVQARGFTVAHIKTDSIKIPDATPEIIQFCMDFEKPYGYTFEHEATYEKMCLVNQAVYIAKYASSEACDKLYGYIPGDNAKAEKKGKMWTATGTQFQVPYVFKKLFSGEDIALGDLCETKSVTKGDIYLDMNEDLGEDEHKYRFVGRVGLFCPILPGHGGGVMYRKARSKTDGEDKYYAVTGTKGYRWLEAEYVQFAHLEDAIDISYYNRLVDEALQTMAKYGDVEWFRSDDPVGAFSVFMNQPSSTDDEVPWYE